MEQHNRDPGAEDGSADEHDYTWTEIWRSHAEHAERDMFLTSLPHFIRRKNNRVPCSLDHDAAGHSQLALTPHDMHSVLTECRSQRCAEAGDAVCTCDEAGRTVCWCRYKVNSCDSSNWTVVFQQGEHVMPDPNVLTPQRPGLTEEMKNYIVRQLTDVPTTISYRLYSVIASKVKHGEMRGPPPRRHHVDNFVCGWKRSNPADEMARVLEMCNQYLYDQVGMDAQDPTATVILCDSVVKDGGCIASVGNGSESTPFRVGITCYKLLHDYVNVQLSPDSTTILHVDTTFKIVKQCYPAMVIGYSDKGGHFFPLAYFSISRRREEDITWCLRHLKRVFFEHFKLGFAPEFVMTDADGAQRNAVLAQIPSVKVLMCWFHVTQNVFKEAKALGATPPQTKSFFADMYDLHYAAQGEYEANKQAVLDKWEKLPPNSAAHTLGRHIKSTWVNSVEFGNWQVFHTPTGCATTNNPLEQYHRTLKINCANPRATPLEMLQSMDCARLAFLGERKVFSNAPEVSDRLHKLYKTLVDRRCITATQLPTSRSQNEVRFAVKQEPLPVNSETLKQYDQSIGSVNARRMQVQDMPSDGWVVVPNQLQCDCWYCWKHGVCPHIIDACVAAGIPCPGLEPSPRRFVTNARRSRPRGRRVAASRRLLLNPPPTNRGVEGSNSAVVVEEALESDPTPAASDPEAVSTSNVSSTSSGVGDELSGAEAVNRSSGAGARNTGDDDGDFSGNQAGGAAFGAPDFNDVVQHADTSAHLPQLSQVTCCTATTCEAQPARHTAPNRATRPGDASGSVTDPSSCQGSDPSVRRRSARRRRPTARAVGSREQAQKRPRP